MSEIKSHSGYGKKLEIIRKNELGPCFDVALEEKTAYIVGGCSLYVADVELPGNLEITGRLSGLGSVRQVAVQNKLAYISSRADGVFIVDASNPEKPFLLCHYDSVELATGIFVSGNLLFVANRDFGVEIIDAGNPEKPVHLSSAHTGEAQSVYVQGNYLYAGVWSAAKLVTVNISNPCKPEITAKADLDGFGDGVCIQGRYAYAATGHHQPLWLKTGRTSESRGYGRGHGLEIFDIAEPGNPVFLSRIKFPPFYNIYPDTWKVTVSGKYAFCTDSYNGIFIIDISDPATPFCVAYRQIGYNGGAEKAEPAVGLAVADGYIYVAGFYSGLFTIPAKEYARQPEAIVAGPLRILPFKERTEPHKDCRIYKPDGQVYALAFIENDFCIVAAGRAGFRVVRLWPEIKEIAAYQTPEIVFNVFIRNHYLYVSEGMAGLSVWEHRGNGKFVLRGRYIPGAKALDTRLTVKNALVGYSGRFAFLQIDYKLIEIVDVSDPENIRKVMEKNMGYIPGDQTALVKDRYACVYSHISGSGIFWYDLEPEGAPLCINGPVRDLSYKSGIGGYKDRLLVISSGKYKLVTKKEKDIRGLDEFQIAPGVAGDPAVYNNILFISDRREGKVYIVDISDAAKPRLIAKIKTAGNPGRAVVYKDALLVPDGYEGLRIYDLKRLLTSGGGNLNVR